MQIAIIYAVIALLIVYVVRCAFVYGRRTSKMPTGESLLRGAQSTQKS